MLIGISRKILDCIKHIYEDGKSGVNVNGHIDWFSIDFGVKQGDTLSATLFGLKTKTNVFDFDTFVTQCLLYTDDLVLIAESEENLQKILL